MRPEMLEYTGDLPVRARVLSISEYPYHWHDAIEIIMVLEGQATVGIGGETHLLGENDIAVINVNEIHRIQKSGGANKLLVVQLEADFCASSIRDFRYTFFQCCSAYHEAGPPEKYTAVKATILRLVSWLIGYPDEYEQINIINCLEELLSELEYGFDYLRHGSGIQAFEEKQVQRHKRIYEYAMNPPGKTHSLAEMAKALGISAQHLSNDIKVRFGLTYQELLFCGKCMEAARLLLGSDKLVRVIAAECGFSDVKYLIKHFKLNYGCTPSDFRKKHGRSGEPLSESKYEEYPLLSILPKVAL